MAFKGGKGGPVFGPKGEEVDFVELLTGFVVDNDPQQGFAAGVATDLSTNRPGVLRRSNFLLVGDEGAGISTVLGEMLGGRVPGADLSGPGVLTARLTGNQSTTQILRSIAVAQDNRLNIPTDNASAGRLHEAIRHELVARQIRTIVILEGELVATMKKRDSQAMMTVLNALLTQAGCAAVIHASPASKDRFLGGEIGERIFVERGIGKFLSQREIQRYGENWDEELSKNGWGGLPFGGQVAIPELGPILFRVTDRSLAAVTDAIKKAIILATTLGEKFARKHLP